MLIRVGQLVGFWCNLSDAEVLLTDDLEGLVPETPG